LAYREGQIFRWAHCGLPGGQIYAHIPLILCQFGRTLDALKIHRTWDNNPLHILYTGASKIANFRECRFSGEPYSEMVQGVRISCKQRDQMHFCLRRRHGFRRCGVQVHLWILCDVLQIAGSPFQFTVGPITDVGAHKVRAIGPGLEKGEVFIPSK